MAPRNRRAAAGFELAPVGLIPPVGSGSGDGDTGSGDGIDTGTGPVVVDPASVLEPGDGTGDGGAGGSVAGEPRKRGRKPGSTNRTRTKETSLSVSGLETLLLGVHQMGAALLKTSELELDPAEAKSLAQASANVLRHYPSVQMPAQMIDWVALAMALGTVYAPRVIAIRNNRIAAKRVPSLDEIRAANGNPVKENVGSVAASTAVSPTPAPRGPAPAGMVQTEIPGMPGVRILRGNGT